jgi:hypothetical protein
VTAHGFRTSYDENVLELDSDVYTPFEYSKTHWITHFQMVDFMASELLFQ